ncbi:Proprotein convertase subtilisin/kexin type 7 [Bonamia ostreae]|uniref:subtilisin n=1 Tax=Bonamia ostreae TaxID=126728 RepID=A0ABV2AQL4_9EUKA
MNVVPVWQDCINGTGITVGVVDGGIMWKDPDISHKKVSMNFRFENYVKIQDLNYWKQGPPGHTRVGASRSNHILLTDPIHRGPLS